MAVTFRTKSLLFHSYNSLVSTTESIPLLSKKINQEGKRLINIELRIKFYYMHIELVKFITHKITINYLKIHGYEKI